MYIIIFAIERKLKLFRLKKKFWRIKGSRYPRSDKGLTCKKIRAFTKFHWKIKIELSNKFSLYECNQEY